MTNLIADTFEKIAATQDPDARWAAAVKLSEALGFTNVLVAKANGTLKDIHWMNTNMPADWIEEYIAQSYVDVDPLVSKLAHGSASMALASGQLSREDAPSERAYDYDHGLKGAGLSTLMCTHFGQANVPGTYVTLCSDTDIVDMQRQSPIDLKLFSALLSIVITEPVKSVPNSTLLQAEVALTVRQREVLSLLADGYQNVGISEKLGITEVAVRKHFAAARQVLGAATREQAMAIALQKGLLFL